MSTIKILQTKKRQLEHKISSIDDKIKEENLAVLVRRYGGESDTEIDTEFLERNLPDLVNKIKAEAVLSVLDNCELLFSECLHESAIAEEAIKKYAKKLQDGDL